MKSVKRVGIYSGSFDPIHNGHVAFALAALKQAKLDKIFFLVEPRPRRKQGVKAFEHRVAMVRLALKHHAQLGTIVLEHQRFTVQETLPILENRFKGAELYLLLGDDFFTHLVHWPQVTSLLNKVRFIVGSRAMSKLEIKEQVRIIEKTKSTKFHYEVVQTPQSEISSRRVRAQVKKGNLDVPVEPSVLRYIKREGLYQSKSKS